MPTKGGEVPAATESAPFDAVPDLVTVVDASGRITDANGAASRLVGRDPASLVGTRLTDLVHDADAAAVESLLRSEGVDRAEARVRADDEWLTLSFVRGPDRAGPVDGVVLTARDVTAARRTRERFRQLVEAASDVLVVLDGDGTVGYATPALERVLGHDPVAFVGENALSYVHPDDRERVAAELGRGIADPGYTATVEHRFRTGSGEWLWLESRGRSLADAEAPSLAGSVVVVTRDVTDRRRRERRIAAQAERLDEFAGLVSHDLRGPLSVASGALDLYRRTGDESALDRVDDAHRRMSRLTTELLALAREGSDAADRRPVRLADCATAALDTTPLPADRVTVSGSLPTVEADPSRLRSLFENLFRNVADHAGPDASVRVGPLPDDAGVFVEDDGPGVPSSAAETVFERGYSTADGGTGYGLAVVADVAAAHGWTTRVTDGRDGGARFEFEFASASASASASSDADRGDAESVEGDSESVEGDSESVEGDEKSGETERDEVGLDETERDEVGLDETERDEAGLDEVEPGKRASDETGGDGA